MDAPAEPAKLTPEQQTVLDLQNDLQALVLSPEAKPKHFAQMEQRINRALSAFPHSRGLLYLAGTYFLQTDRAGLAVPLLRLCMSRIKEQAGETFAVPDAWLNLAAAYKLEHMDADAEECYLKALAIADAKPEAERALHKANAFHGLASLYVNRGMPERIVHYADKALQHMPTDRFALWNKGLALLEMQQWGPGFDLYDKAGFMDGQGKPRDRKLKEYGGNLTRWMGETGKGVVCYGEQGVGDEIMFFSMLPDLIRDCSEVVVECDKRIAGLLRHSFPTISVYPTSDIDAPYDWLKNHPGITHYVPCGSLGMYYRRRAEDWPRTPYFKPEPWMAEKWGRILADCPRPRIALSWSGGLKKTRSDKRSLTLDMLEPLLRQDATFFSLQYHPTAADECALIGTRLGKPIFHFEDAIGGPLMPGYSNTAGFLSHMDLFVTVNTSAVHLAGALGVPTLCLTPKWRAWRYSGQSGPHPMYGSVTQINQDTDGEWGPVIEQAAEAVREMIAATPKPTPEVCGAAVPLAAE